MGLETLNLDTLLLVLGHLNLEELVSLRCVSRRFDSVVLANLPYLTQLDYYSISDALVARILLQEISQDKFSCKRIIQIITRVRALSKPDTARRCRVEHYCQAISASLTAFKGRMWVSQNLDNPIDFLDPADDGLIMVLSAWLGQLEVVQRCLSHGVPVDTTHDGVGSALYAAAFNNNEALTRLLIQHGVNVEKEEGAYGEALQLAAYRGSLRVLHLLISEDTRDRVTKCGLHGSPLGAAAAAGHEAAVELLLQWQDNPNLGTHFNQSPLLLAAKNGRTGVVRVLLSCLRVDPNLADYNDKTPLTVAVEEGHDSVVSILLERRTVDATRPPNLLEIMAGRGNIEIVQTLLQRPDVRTESRIDRLPSIHAAALNDHIEVIDLLIRHDNINFENPNNPYKCVLPWAAGHGLINIVSLLLHWHHVDPNTRDAKGKTAIYAALLNNHEAVARLLLHHEHTDPNISGLEDKTALMLAVQQNNLPSVRLLLENIRTESNNPDVNGMTELMFALHNRNMDMFRLLLPRCPDPNAQQFAGESALHMACTIASTEAVQALLLLENIDINIQDKHGYTPLHRAVYSTDPDALLIIRLLLQQTAKHIDPDITNIHGLTPLQFATRLGRTEAVQVLFQHGDQPRKSPRSRIYYGYGELSRIGSLLSKRNLRG